MPKTRATDFEDLPVATVPVKKLLVALRHAQATTLDSSKRGEKGHHGSLYTIHLLGGKARRIELAYGTERQMALYAVTDVEWPDVKAHSADPRRSAPSIWMHRMPNRLTVARAWLLECCRRAIKDKADKIAVESKLNTITASWLRRTKEGPDNRVLKEIRASGEDGESFNEQPFNPRYLGDALAACDENVVTLYAPPKKGDACVLGDTVIMPMIDSKGA